MYHLQDKRPTGAHLNLTDVESEPEEGLQEGALPIRLPSESHYLRNRQLLPEGHCCSLQPIVSLEPRFDSRGRRRRGEMRSCDGLGGGGFRHQTLLRFPSGRRGTMLASYRRLDGGAAVVEPIGRHRSRSG